MNVSQMKPEQTDSKIPAENGRHFKFTKSVVRAVSIQALALVVLASLLMERTILGQNDGSRWDTVWSLTHGKGYVIDSAPYGTIDKVYRDGHFYSSKPALLPVMVAGITFAVS